jgi:lysophospholipase L1-like esterase
VTTPTYTGTAALAQSDGVRYVAIGDSFTEGVGDERPDGSVRGWADFLAAGLASAGGEPVHYANLAVRGRLLAPIVTEQLDAALALSPRPTLITLNGGGNDMLRPRTDLARLASMTAFAVRRCVAAGVRLVVLSGADPSDHIPFGPTVRRRGEELTARIATVVATGGVDFVDVFHDEEIRHAAYWSADRLHLNAIGHQRVAGLVLAALGAGDVPVPGEFPPPAPRRLGTEALFYRDHVWPWVQRRLQGRSSGDRRGAKHHDWTVIEAPDRPHV